MCDVASSDDPYPLFQDTVDNTDERIELRANRRPRPDITRWHRIAQQLPDRARVDPKTTRRFALAQTLNHYRVVRPPIQFHSLHPPPFAPKCKGLSVQRGSVLITDELRSYDTLKKDGPYQLYRVNHSKGEYVWETIHTNTIEGYWSRLKNSIRGTHVHVSSKHLWKYVSEFSYRYNMRSQPELMFHGLIQACALPHLADG